MGRAFTKIADTLAIDRSAMVVDVGHQKLVEVLDDRPSNMIISDPLDDGFRLDVAQLPVLQGHLLLYSIMYRSTSNTLSSFFPLLQMSYIFLVDKLIPTLDISCSRARDVIGTHLWQILTFAAAFCVVS